MQIGNSMFFKKLLNRKAVKEKVEDEKEGTENEEVGDFYFSTDLKNSRLSHIIESNHKALNPELPTVDIDGVSYGMDSSIRSSSNTATVSSLRSTLNQPLFAWYTSQGFIGYQACAIIAQNWLVNKCCALKGRDAIKKGFEININNGEEHDEKLIPKIKELNKEFKLKKNLEQASKFNNVFGIRHVLFLVELPDDDLKEYYSNPFNIDSIKPFSYKGMSQIDPYWISPLLDQEDVANPMSQGFYEPTYWWYNGLKIHRSHFIILRGGEVADILKPSYLYGGLPLTQMLYERVYAAERTANEAPLLAMTKRLTWRKIDVSKAIMDQAKFESNMIALQEYRDNYGVNFIGEEEDIGQLDTSLNDLDDVISSQYQLVSSISNIPATKLFGKSPKGFESTGNYESDTYHEELENIRENDLTPIIDKHHQMLVKSHIEHTIDKSIEIDITWLPNNIETRKETAEINEIKARTLSAYQQTGAIDAYDIAKELINDEYSGFSGMELDDDASEYNQDMDSMDYVREEDNQWFVFSEKGKKLSQAYSSKADATKRLRQIEYFKNKE